MDASPAPALLLDLRRATESAPLARKVLVCSTMGAGRELLRAMVVRGWSWLGWEVTTPRRLAVDLVAHDVEVAGLRIADLFDEEAAVDVALDAAVRDAAPVLRELAETAGFRQAVAGAVGALRLAGVEQRALDNGPDRRPTDGMLATVFGGYVRRLEAERLIDTAGVLERAARALEQGAAGVPEGSAVWLTPGLTLRGLSGRLVRALQATGAGVLRTDPVAGPRPQAVLWAESGTEGPLSRIMGETGRSPSTSPDLRMFAASGPAEELREVVRRVMEAGARWDEVEIIATDPVVYGGALHALGERLGIPVSFAVGLPVERTRAGRAAAAYLRWIQTGYPSESIRRLLEAGDLRSPVGGATGARLARRLRRLRIGWGADRYLPAVDAALRALEGPVRPRRDESPADAGERRASERLELEALRALLAAILTATPRLDADAGAAPADIAKGLRSFLELVPDADSPSATARQRMLGIADRVGARLTRSTAPAAAVAVVERHLQIRVPAPNQEGSSPWISAGGYLHLSDIDHGGLTGRRMVFVVGLDADRFPGSDLQDPLLADARRRALAPDALPTSADRIAATRFRLAGLLARLRGTVTLSYSAWDPTQARELAPSAVLLQAHRLVAGDPTASFEDLRRVLGRPASAVPAGAVADETDVWLRALERRGVLLDGVGAVRSAFPSLARGLNAGAALVGERATSHHGLVTPRPDRLDPRRNRNLVLSATGLQDLGTCGRRYFYRYVLGVRPPEDRELDPDRWLDPLARGSLLHAVYERTLREARPAELRAGTPQFLDLALRILEEEAAAVRRDLPAPGDAVHAREMTALREDVRSFAGMMEGADQRWESLELMFGLDGAPPAPLELRGGQIRLRGAIDRVDREAAGLVVIDYKTGGHERYEAKSGAFDGGRRLQNAIYAAVAEALLGDPVDRMEYHFPTRRGQNEVIAYPAAVLRRGLDLIDRLLDITATGRFLPTDSGGDCRFCDYAAICRHRSEGRAAETPLADWARGRLPMLAEYAVLRDVRDWEAMNGGAAGGEG